MIAKTFLVSTAASAVVLLTAQESFAWGCARAAVGRGYAGAAVYNNGGYGAVNYGGCYGAGFAVGGGPAALVGGPQQNPNYIPIPTVAPPPPSPPVDPLDDQTIQDGPYSPGVYGRPAGQSGTPLGN